MSSDADTYAIQVANHVPEQRRAEFQMMYQSQKKNRTTALLLGWFLGMWGIDRFYVGHTGLGVAKLLTAGGCGLWWIIDLFLIMGATDAHNRSTVEQLRAAYAQGGGQQQPHYY